MHRFQIQFHDVVEVCGWCIDNFGPSYTMPHWWRLEKIGDDYLVVVRYNIELLEEADAALFALRWLK